ncbi:MAG: hypothetical protein ABIZ05_10145 [Pseudonocardiaceae bacterium]
MTDHTDTANGHRGADPAVVAGAWPMVLLRYRPGVVGKSGRTVHLVPLPPEGQADTAGVAWCGALLRPGLVERVGPGQGVPCALCTVNHRGAGCAPEAPTAAVRVERINRGTGPLAAAGCYRAWGWPVTPRGHQVWLDLEPDTVAVTIPAPLALHATTILTQWGCPPPALIVHPDAPEHRIVLAAERHNTAPPYPRSVHRTTGALPLPPTTTPRGRLTWVYPPQAGPLRLCREFEVFAALRTVLRDSST